MSVLKAGRMRTLEPLLFAYSIYLHVTYSLDTYILQTETRNIVVNAKKNWDLTSFKKLMIVKN